MGASAEGQARIKHNIHCIFIRDFAPARANPQLFAKLHRVKMFHPFPDPVLVLQLFNLALNLAIQILFDEMHNSERIDISLKQSDYHGIGP